MDLAEWFCTVEEVRAYVDYKGWAEADFHGLRHAWAEASRKEVQALPDVATPEHLQAPPPPGLVVRVAPEGEAEVSLDTLSPPAPQPPPDSGPIRQALQNLYFELGPQGAFWDPHEPLEEFALLARAALRIDGETIKSYLLAWARWRRWWHSAERPPTSGSWCQPAPRCVAAFLDSELEQGYTLGRHQMKAFSFFARHLGLPFPVSDAALADFRNLPEAKPDEAQAVAMTPGEFAALVSHLNQCASPPVEAEMLLFMAVTCTRSRHLARSKVTKVTDQFVFAYCHKGKLRQRGKRLPFHFATPRLRLRSGPAFGGLLDVARRMGHPDFLVPARRAATRKLPRRWIPQPMGHSQTIRVMQEKAAKAGWAATPVSRLSFNTARRFLPTAADVLGFDHHVKQAVGNWEDGQPSAGTRTTPRPMSLLYSDARALSSGEAKVKVLDKLLATLAKYPAAAKALEGNPCTTEVLELSWEDLALAARSLPPEQMAASSSDQNPLAPAPSPAPQPDSQSGRVVEGGAGEVVGASEGQSEAERPSRKRPPRVGKRQSYQDRRR